MSTNFLPLPGRLNAVLQRSGLSQSEFCKKLGISDRTYKNYQNEVTEISSGVLRKIHDEFDIDIRWLLLGEGFIDAMALGEVVEMAVRETRKSIRRRGLSLEPEREAKVVRYLVQQVRENGELSEQAKRDFFETIS